MYMGKQQFPLPAAYTVTYGVRLCDQVCRLSPPPVNPDSYPQVSSFTISPDGLMTYDKQGTINGPDGQLVVLTVLAVLEGSPRWPPGGGEIAALLMRPHWKRQRTARPRAAQRSHPPTTRQGYRLYHASIWGTPIVDSSHTAQHCQIELCFAID
jgi:hypothetical protein